MKILFSALITPSLPDWYIGRINEFTDVKWSIPAQKYIIKLQHRVLVNPFIHSFSLPPKDGLFPDSPKFYPLFSLGRLFASLTFRRAEWDPVSLFIPKELNLLREALLPLGCRIHPDLRQSSRGKVTQWKGGLASKCYCWYIQMSSPGNSVRLSMGAQIAICFGGGNLLIGSSRRSANENPNLANIYTLIDWLIHDRLINRW